MDANSPVLAITGASSDIGAATARLAADRGWRLVLAARTGTRLDAIAAGLGGPAVARAVRCDVSDWDQVSVLPAAALDAFGRLDAVFANAGTCTATSFLTEGGAPDQWREMVLTNVYPGRGHRDRRASRTPASRPATGPGQARHDLQRYAPGATVSQNRRPRSSSL